MFVLKNRLLKALTALNMRTANSKLKNKEIMLGRWHINYDEDKLHTIVKLANEDNCGICIENKDIEEKITKLDYQYSYDNYKNMYIIDDINVKNTEFKLVCCGKKCSNCVAQKEGSLRE